VGGLDQTTAGRLSRRYRRPPMASDPRTIEYFARRIKEGKTKKEAMRCLKRYVARELFPLLPREQIGLDSP
jgi:transposase